MARLTEIHHQQAYVPNSQVTTKDSHTSLPRSLSLNRPTNPRNKPQTILKRKHNSRSEDHVWFEDRWMVTSLCDE
jgi:hypothetical protein